MRFEGNMPFAPDMGFGRKILVAIQDQPGEIRTIAPEGEPLEPSRAALASYGLEPAEGACALIRTKAGALASCPLREIGG